MTAPLRRGPDAPCRLSQTPPSTVPCWLRSAPVQQPQRKRPESTSRCLPTVRWMPQQRKPRTLWLCPSAPRTFPAETCWPPHPHTPGAITSASIVVAPDRAGQAASDPAGLALTVTHELGHVLGLGHADSTASAMSPTVGPVGSDRGGSGGVLRRRNPRLPLAFDFRGWRTVSRHRLTPWLTSSRSREYLRRADECFRCCHVSATWSLRPR